MTSADSHIVPPPVPQPMRPVGPPPWSAAAIAGFVCSLLGCLGITAIAGLILGIIGVVNTSGGRRRGFGFAVAAIPLSLLAAIGSAGLILTVVVGRQFIAVPERIESVFAHLPGAPTQAATALREFTSDDFNASVDAAALERWFQAVVAKHGTLTKVLIDPNDFGISRSPDEQVAQTIRAKFVNDTVDIVITYAKHSGFAKLKFDDITIGDLSPRDPLE